MFTWYPVRPGSSTASNLRRLWSAFRSYPAASRRTICLAQLRSTKTASRRLADIDLLSVPVIPGIVDACPPSRRANDLGNTEEGVDLDSGDAEGDGIGPKKGRMSAAGVSAAGVSA